jgi:hypothetical protein
MKALVMDLLSPASIRSLGFLDEAAVSRVRDRFMIELEPLGFEIWGLCVLVAWVRARLVSDAGATRDRGPSDLVEVQVPFRAPRETC